MFFTKTYKQIMRINLCRIFLTHTHVINILVASKRFWKLKEKDAYWVYERKREGHFSSKHRPSYRDVNFYVWNKVIKLFEKLQNELAYHCIKVKTQRLKSWKSLWIKNMCNVFICTARQLQNYLFYALVHRVDTAIDF